MDPQERSDASFRRSTQALAREQATSEAALWRNASEAAQLAYQRRSVLYAFSIIWHSVLYALSIIWHSILYGSLYEGRYNVTCVLYATFHIICNILLYEKFIMTFILLIYAYISAYNKPGFIICHIITFIFHNS